VRFASDLSTALRRALAGAVLALLACGLATPEARAEEPGAAEAEIPTAEVVVDGRSLFRVRGTTSYPAPERAAAIAARIVSVARDGSIPVASIAVEPATIGLEIQAAGRPLMNLIPADAALESVQLRSLAEVHRRRISEAIERYRADREPRKLLRGVGLAIGATLALVALVVVLSRAFRTAAALFERLLAARIERLPSAARHLVQARQLRELIGSTLRGLHWLTLLVASFMWLEYVLSQFPWTRGLGDELLVLLIRPLEQMAAGFLDFVPSLAFLIMLAVVTRYGLRLVRLVFTAVERRNITLGTFDPDWAGPAYKLIRVVVIALALVMAYPYLPGSGSEALKGISVFGGLMLSLGASTMVSNVLAGYLNTFGRVFRVGDVIQIGEVRGHVTQIRLLTTRVRTPKNEEVTLPNSVLLGNHVVNYSTLAQSDGLILHTEVGIGYETPWRQVHAMLEEAARRTPELRREPAPFILQRKLADFAVVYELNAHASSASGMLQAYSRLHQNILDVFNEHGVQIMTPAYESDPEQPKIVPKEQWFAAPAKPEGAPPSA
jgi:small-conductance mechanosensitive channel